MKAFFFLCFSEYNVGRRLKGRLGPYLVSKRKLQNAKDVGLFQRKLLGVSWSDYGKRQIYEHLAPDPNLGNVKIMVVICLFGFF